jgi:hypothetical protein
MKKIAISKLLLASAFMAAPAAAQNISFDSLPSVKDIVSQARSSEISVPAPSLTPDTRAPKEWTLMVFMNGKNNLSSYVHTDMNEMEAVGSTDKMNVVVEAGRIYQAPPSYPNYPGGYDGYDNPWGGGVVPHPGWPNPDWNMPPAMGREGEATTRSSDWTGVRRYYVLKDTDTAVTSSQLLQELPKTDMGDWNQLVQFVKWAKAAYPAKKYMLVVWNHGDGWKTKSPGSQVLKGISYDDETGNGITTVQLGQALAGMGGVDIYASDACLMQMAEVVYELKNYAPVIVGSEETEPGDGWDYAAFLSRVNPANLSPEAVAKAAVEGYNASYTKKGSGVTMSAVRSLQAEPLRLLSDQWADLAMAQDRPLLKAALTESKSFAGADSRDLLHFLSLAGAKIPALAAKGAEINALVQKKMLILNAPSGDSYKNAMGLGIYLPTYGFDANYSKLALSKAGKWDEFANWLNAK